MAETIGAIHLVRPNAVDCDTAAADVHSDGRKYDLLHVSLVINLISRCTFWMMFASRNCINNSSLCLERICVIDN